MIRATINTQAADKLIAELVARAANLTAPFRIAAARLRADVMRNFRDGGFFPQVWTPSNKTKGKTLLQRGTLRNSFHADSSAGYAAVGSDLIYAAIHQFGGTIVPRPENTTGRLRFRVGGQWVSPTSVTIPARPMLPVDSAGSLHPTTQRFIADTFLDHLIKGGAA